MRVIEVKVATDEKDFILMLVATAAVIKTDPHSARTTEEVDAMNRISAAIPVVRTSAMIAHKIFPLSRLQRNFRRLP